jgi:ATP-dependent DNA helicase DinG
MPNHDWKCFFPHKTVRDEQTLAINAILDSFEGGKKIFVLEAGTGVGKSAIAVTVGRYIKAHFGNCGPETKQGSNIITTQKLLQAQYEKDYVDINSLKSSTNYGCGHHKKLSCNDSRKLLKTEEKNTRFWKNCMFNCTYKKAKEKFIKEPYGVTNFAYFLTETRYSGKIPRTSLLVIDEAHNTPDELSRFIEVTFSDRFAKSFVGIELPEHITPAAFVKWITEKYYPVLAKKILDFRIGLEKFTSLKSRVESGEFSKLSRQLEILTGHDLKVQTFLKLYDKDNWLMSEIPAEERTSRKVEFKPIDIAPYAHDYLFKLGEYTLLMSATIVDVDRFSQLCGITGKAGSIKIPCPFPIENRPIIYSGAGKMSAREIDKTLPKLVKTVKAIMDEHKNDKGIIHCRSYKIAWYIKRNIRSSRFLIHDSSNRDEVLQQHISSTKPTILLSPSMTEGVDLKGDLSRFQIVCKVPFPFLGDKLIRKKMNKWDWWYDLQTAKTIIQSVGRSVRSETDTAVTYILDSSWERFFNKNKALFGPEFL